MTMEMTFIVTWGGILLLGVIIGAVAIYREIRKREADDDTRSK